jgi:hypothetical protein
MAGNSVQSGRKMFNQCRELYGYEVLFAELLRQAGKDLFSTDKCTQREAVRFFSSPRSAFNLWCDLANLDKTYLLNQIRKTNVKYSECGNGRKRNGTFAWTNRNIA